MIKVSSEQDKVWVAKVHEAGQAQVFDGWDGLSAEEQKALLDQLREIDFQLLKRLIQQHIHGTGEAAEERVVKPAEVTLLSGRDEQEQELARTLGEYALKNGEVGLVMAAGQSSAPSGEPFGMLPVGPVTGKSLFQLQAEKIQALNRHYRISLHWFLFCHPAQLETISAFFKTHNYFGLNCSDLHFCAQELLPVVNRRGKLLLETPGRVAMHPIGDGGILTQLLAEERLRTLERAGIKHLFFFQADNALIQIADPSFVGMHIENQSDVSSKAIRHKGLRNDGLPVFCTFNNSPGVIHRSELSVEDRERKTSDGHLVFGAAPIGAHLFSVDFLRQLQSSSGQRTFTGVPQITQYVGKRGRVQRPSEPNSIRFQRSVFDAFAHARRSRIVETRREDEFSPIRNTSGAESPQTAQRDLSLLYTRWLREACDEELVDEAGSEAAVEISPLYALDAAELKDKIELPVHAEDGAILLGGKA